MCKKITIDDCVAFHGHVCGGIALGYVLAQYAMEKLGACREDALCARVECVSCPVDAVQCVTGCTAGKRTLEVVDAGCTALTLVRKETRRGIRAEIAVSVPAGLSKAEALRYILSLDPAAVCRWEPAALESPPDR